MRALTIWQPWASAIALGFKPVENRDWAPPASSMGELFAIHAAVRVPTEVETLEVATTAAKSRKQWEALPTTSVRGAVIAVARLVTCIDDEKEDLDALPSDVDRWFVGRFGWIFREVKQIEPVVCVGRQGIWRLPLDVYEKVQAQLQLQLKGVG